MAELIGKPVFGKLPSLSSLTREERSELVRRVRAGLGYTWWHFAVVLPSYGLSFFATLKFGIATIPLGWLIAVLAPLGMLRLLERPIWWLQWRRVREYYDFHLYRAGRCVECGYDVRELHDRCPECGMPILH